MCSGRLPREPVRHVCSLASNGWPRLGHEELIKSNGPVASLGRWKSYFEFMRESIISGIKEYRPMKSKHSNANAASLFGKSADGKDKPK